MSVTSCGKRAPEERNGRVAAGWRSLRARPVLCRRSSGHGNTEGARRPPAPLWYTHLIQSNGVHGSIAKMDVSYIADFERLMGIGERNGSYAVGIRCRDRDVAVVGVTKVEGVITAATLNGIIPELTDDENVVPGAAEECVVSAAGE
jgi:hypothetical protein